MSSATYTKYELKRTFRNRRFLILSLGIPLVFYYLVAAQNRTNHNFGGDATHHTGIFAPQYYMVSLLAFGGMSAVLGCGARIAAERQVGWNRTLRLTPLSPRAYFRAKIATSYSMALCAMALLYVAGLSLGVRMPVGRWFTMSLLVLIALIPFAALGIGLGHLLTVDSMGPALGGGVAILAFLGGTWFPITGSGGFVTFCKALPSYWLVQAGHVGLTGKDPWGLAGWLVLGAWTVATVGFAMWAYRRDTKRV
jgi:ABC-2 type transport system permease protein